MTEPEMDCLLRDRIAAVLMRDSFGLTTQTAVLRQADAIIRELGLRRENVERLHRYVTDWQYA